MTVALRVKSADSSDFISLFTATMGRGPVYDSHCGGEWLVKISNDDAVVFKLRANPPYFCKFELDDDA